MIIEIQDVQCRVVSATDDEQDWIQGYLSFADSSFRGRKNKRVSLYNALRGTFPGGLLQLMRDAAVRDGVKLEELDKRVTRVIPDANADVAWLRDYQKDAVEACVKAKRGIVHAPTGSGKGDMIVGLIRRLPGRWLFLVHRDQLVEQQAKRFKKINGGLTPNILSRTPPSEWKLNPGVNLMTLQSLAAGIRRDRPGVDKALAKLDGLVIDECHVAPADVYFSAINRCPAEYRFGFSGTPLDRTDNRSLMAIAALGKVIYRVKAQVLIDAGILALPRITMVRVKQLPTQDAKDGGFHGLYDELIAVSEVRNARLVEIVKAAPKPCMVFVKIIEHGHAMKRLIEEAKISCEFVWGNTKSEQRSAAIERLERRDADVMIASVVFQEGVDIPSLESVVIASGGKSVIAALQRIGRGMRTNNGTKATFEVYDVLDVGTVMLEKHSKRRMKTYVREGYQTIVQDELGTQTLYQPKLMTRREKRIGA